MNDGTHSALQEAYDLLDCFYHLDEGSEEDRSLNSKYFRDSVYRMIPSANLIRNWDHG